MPKKLTQAQKDRRLLFPIEMQDELPRVLKINEASLFPNSPIEVVFEQRSFAVYCEGQWASNEDTVNNVKARIRELIRSNREAWAAKATRINPTWPGWSKVNVAALYELIGAGNVSEVPAAS